MSKIKIEITRGPGIMVDDNNDKFMPIDTKDKIYIKKAKEKGKIISFEDKYTHYSIDVSQNRYPLGYCQTCHCKI